MTTVERIAAVPATARASGTAIPADCNPRIATLFRYWQMKRPGPHLLPGRQHLSPTEIYALLRHVWLCDVQRHPVRFRYRLIGSTISYLMTRDHTGSWLDDVHEDFLSSAAYADFMAAVETGSGAYYKGPPLFHLEKEYIWMERLLLPLARNGTDVDMLLGITVYGPPRDAADSEDKFLNA